MQTRIIRSFMFGLAMVMLFALPAAAKKGKTEGTAVPPKISAEQAVAAVKAVLPKISAGKAFVKEGKRGDKKLEVPLVLDSKIVARMQLNPATGEILSKGLKPQSQQVAVTLEQAQTVVQQALPNLQAGAARLSKDGQWKVDMTLKGAAVADISVNGQDGSILADWKASKDVERWGK
jgi:hypothetical protein